LLHAVGYGFEGTGRKVKKNLVILKPASLKFDGHEQCDGKPIQPAIVH
jgi:hypothetical protein